MISIPSYIEELRAYKPGLPVAVLKEALSLDRVAILWNNENNFGMPPKAREAMLETVEISNLYPDPTSELLRQRIVAMNDYRIEVNQVVAGNGSEGLLNDIFTAFFDKDDEFITSEGTFAAVYIWAKAHNVKTIRVPLTDEYGFDVKAIVGAITPKTKAIYLCNPNNPTGKMISADELKWAIDNTPREVLIIVDEAYYEFAKAIDKDYPDSLDYQSPNVLTLRTFSKAYGVAGARIGYAMGPAHLIQALNKVKLTFTPSNLAQATGYGASRDEEFLKMTIENNLTWLPRFYEVFDRLGIQYVRSTGNFVMIALPSAGEAEELMDQLLRKGAFTRLLTAFGLPHCIRITIGRPEENEWFLEKLNEVYSES